MENTKHYITYTRISMYMNLTQSVFYIDVDIIYYPVIESSNLIYIN